MPTSAPIHVSVLIIVYLFIDHSICYYHFLLHGFIVYTFDPWFMFPFTAGDI